MALELARLRGWLVVVYHDGSVEPLLRRFRSHYPVHVLRLVYVSINDDHVRRQKYLPATLRLLAADDSRLDVFAPDVAAWCTSGLHLP